TLKDTPVSGGLTPNETNGPWQTKAGFTATDDFNGTFTGTLNPGDSFSITWKGKLDPSSTGTLENDATATLPNAVGAFTPASQPYTGKDTETLTPQYTLTVTKTLKGNCRHGQTCTWNIKVVNNGPSATLGLTLADSGGTNFTANGSWTAPSGTLATP